MKAYFKSMKTVVSERGQITLPKKIRTDLGIRPGTVLEISVIDGKVVGWKQDEKDALKSWRGKGMLPVNAQTVDEYLQAIRG